MVDHDVMSSSWGAFLFTDVEGSTRLWDQSPDVAAQAIAEQDEVIRWRPFVRGPSPPQCGPRLTAAADRTQLRLKE